MVVRFALMVFTYTSHEIFTVNIIAVPVIRVLLFGGTCE